MGAQVELKGPGRSMLVGKMKVSLRDFRRDEQSVMLEPLLLPQRLKTLSAEHLAQSVRSINGAVDDDVGDMNALASKLRVQRLTQHTPAAHGRGMRMLARITAHGGRGRCHQQHPFSAFLHTREHRLREAKQTERRHPPAHLKLLQGRGGEAPVPDLRSKVEHRCCNRPNMAFDVTDQLFNAAFFHCVDDVAAGGAALRLNFCDKPVQALSVGPSCENRVVALPGEPLRYIAANSGPGAKD